MHRLNRYRKFGFKKLSGFGFSYGFGLFGFVMGGFLILRLGLQRKWSRVINLGLKCLAERCPKVINLGLKWFGSVLGLKC
ncbi:hypothetical protein HanRHA438_Chr15g0710331 [Helianthus annuus]|nr:hypothetical protein HanRHA438_Chr15g0710331 [Helianthus annuus]